MSRQTKLSFCRPRPAKQQCKDNTEPHSEDVQASKELSHPEAPSVESKRHALPTEMSTPSGYTKACHKSDIGFISSIGRINRLSDTDKYALTKEPYVPPPIYTFPKHVEYGKQRSFQQSWVTKFPWLVYSRHIDGGFCLPCALFSKSVLSILL